VRGSHEERQWSRTVLESEEADEDEDEVDDEEGGGRLSHDHFS
jgi:hypothetical protein